MGGQIFIISRDGSLLPMYESDYASEDLLQTLLAQYPQLLAGEQIDSIDPRKWLLVAREAGIPSQDEGSSRWSVDHLFLDQAGIPTLVEVKRSTDTRIRREVVGQMLDYAANAILYWPVESIRARFEARCEQIGRDPESVLEEAFGEFNDIRDYWEHVETNLQAGNMRLLFVADVIPPELQRVIEFLNDQMPRIEVLGVAIKQYTGEGQSTLVPRVVGQIQSAKSGPRTQVTWDKQLFFNDMNQNYPDHVEAVKAIYEWAQTHMPLIKWGKGKTGSFIPGFMGKNQRYQVFYVTPTEVWMQFSWIKDIPDELKLELLNRLRQIPGAIDIPEVDQIIIKQWRKLFRTADLTDNSVRDRFLAAIEWYIDQIKSL